MSLDALKREAAALDDDSRKELFAFLVSLREEEWAAQAKMAAHCLDDADKSGQLTVDGLTSHLDQSPEPPA